MIPLEPAAWISSSPTAHASRFAGLVAFPVMEFEAYLLKREAFAVGLEADPGRGFKRNQFGQAAFRGDFVNAEITMRRVAAAAEENLAVGGPARGPGRGRDDRSAASARRRGGHDIHIVIAFVLGGKGDELAVRGELRKGLLAFVSGKPQGHAAIDRDLPQIAFGGEDDGPPPMVG